MCVWNIGNQRQLQSFYVLVLVEYYRFFHIRIVWPSIIGYRFPSHQKYHKFTYQFGAMRTYWCLSRHFNPFDKYIEMKTSKACKRGWIENKRIARAEFTSNSADQINDFLFGAM